MAKTSSSGKNEIRQRMVSNALTYQQVRRQMLLALKIDRPVFIWGPPGVGKSALCREIAEEMKLNYVDIRMSLLNPVDLRGIPMADMKERVAMWLKPSFIPDGPGNLINFDELNVAPPTVQAAAYQFILDRRCGDHDLPKDTYIVACGNRAEDKAVLFEMPAPLRNRLIHLEMRHDLGDWKSWAFSNGISPVVIGFLNWKEEALFQFDAATHLRGFPSPRSWEFVSDICRALDPKGTGRVDLEDYAPMIEGSVGPGTATEFLAFISVASKLPDIEGIVVRGELPNPPDDPGAMFALSSGLVYTALTRFSDKPESEQIKAIKNVIGYCTKKMPKDFGIVTSKDLGRTDMWDKNRPALAQTKEIKDWVQNVGKVAL